MSQTTTADLDPWNGLYYAVSEGLTPLFKGQGRGKAYATYAAGEAISGYHPESRADYATIGRILALTLSTITAATLAADPGIPATEKIKFLGKVHTLSQAADRAERIMMTRRKWQKTEATRPDTLVPRPHGRPSRYPPLPADDPASGAYQARAATSAPATPPAAEATAPAASAPDQTAAPQPAPPPTKAAAKTPIAEDRPSEQPAATKPEPDSATPDQRTQATPPPDLDEALPTHLMAAMQAALGAHGIPVDMDTLRADFGLPPTTASRPEEKAATFGQRPMNAGKVPVEVS